MGDKRTSKQIGFHHGKGVNGRGARGHSEWSFEPFLFLISSVKLHVWLFFSSFFFYIYLIFSIGSAAQPRS